MNSNVRREEGTKEDNEVSSFLGNNNGERNFKMDGCKANSETICSFLWVVPEVEEEVVVFVPLCVQYTKQNKSKQNKDR